MGGRGGLRAVVGNGPGLECGFATRPGKARVPRNGTGGAGRRLRRQPADRTRVLNRARWLARKRPLLPRLTFARRATRALSFPSKTTSSRIVRGHSLTLAQSSAVV